ncbi:MAG TPA: hypothetical protein VF681_03680 [Abditibacteriaceae bacterium]|jgi:hypothetical protein
MDKYNGLFQKDGINHWKGETKHLTFTTKKVGRAHYLITINIKGTDSRSPFDTGSFALAAHYINGYEAAMQRKADEATLSAQTPCAWMDAIESTQDVWEKVA